MRDCKGLLDMTLQILHENKTHKFNNLSSQLANFQKCNHSIEQFFLVVMFIMLYKVILTFECKMKKLKHDHSNESISKEQ